MILSEYYKKNKEWGPVLTHTHTHFLENYFAEEKVKNDHKSFLRENWFEISDLFSSLLIFTIIKTILSTFFILCQWLATSD
jgi:hypothetical protein